MHRIDVHHHHVPGYYLKKERDRVIGAMDLDPSVLLDWSPQRALEQLDRHEIATAIVSISTPGIWFGDVDASRDLARACNEAAAQMRRDYPGRFGSFAAIPLPDVEGSLREIEYAFETLGADGVGILTSYGDRWPGDRAFAPVFDELNRRKAVVFVHPTVPACCRSLIPDVPPPVTEFLFDTTRAITSLMFGGTFARCPDIRFIFCHGGGTVMVLSTRIDFFAQRHPKFAACVPNGALAELRRLYYDVATTSPASFNALRSVIPASQIVFGSDFPYIPVASTLGAVANLGLDEATLRQIDRENALRLFPQYV